MPLRSIAIANFKNIGSEPQQIAFKPITLLFGPNSSGKSTVLHALHYARDIFERHNLNPGKTLTGGSAVDLGGFESFVHNHDKNREIMLRFDLDLTDEDLPSYDWEQDDIGASRDESEFRSILANVQSAWVTVFIRWSKLLNKPILNRYEVGINGKLLATIEISDDARQVYIPFLNPLNPLFLHNSTFQEAYDTFMKVMDGSPMESDDGEKLGRLFPIISDVLGSVGSGLPGLTHPLGILYQRETALPNWNSILHFDSSALDLEAEAVNRREFIEIISSLIVGPGELVLKSLQELKYIGPLREIPTRNYLHELSPDDAGWASGKAAWDLLSTLHPDSLKLETINSWLSEPEKLNCGYRVEIKRYKELDVEGPLAVAIRNGRNLDDLKWFNEQLDILPTQTRLMLKDTIQEIDVMPQDVGVGISQIIPVVVAAVCTESGIVAVEQPELHVHAAFQVVMGDLFADMIRRQDNKRENRNIAFVLETHSEYMTLRFLRRLYETSQDELEPEAPWLTPDDLAIYYLNPREDGVEITHLRVDEEGEFLDRWPKGFFAERKKELF